MAWAMEMETMSEKDEQVEKAGNDVDNDGEDAELVGWGRD